MTQRFSEHFGLYVSACIARGLVAELGRRGIESSVLCEGTCLTPELLEDPRAQIACDDWNKVVLRALALTGDPALGLTFGQVAPIQTYQIVGWLAMSAPDLRRALNLLRYAYPLLASHVTLQIVERGGDAHLFYDQVALDAVGARMGADFGISALLRFGMQFGLPAGAIREVWFRHAEPAYSADYARLFNCPVRFRKPRNAIVFDRAVLSHSNTSADELASRLLAQHAESLLGPRAQKSVAEKVQVILLQEDVLSAVDSSELAARLGTSARALRWQLAREGRSLRRIVDDVRFYVARRALRNGESSVHALAERLGFSEASAFYRAFKRWTGDTPVSFVERERAGDVAVAAVSESAHSSDTLPGAPALAEPAAQPRVRHDSGVFPSPLVHTAAAVLARG